MTSSFNSAPTSGKSTRSATPSANFSARPILNPSHSVIATATAAATGTGIGVAAVTGVATEAGNKIGIGTAVVTGIRTMIAIGTWTKIVTVSAATTGTGTGIMIEIVNAVATGIGITIATAVANVAATAIEIGIATVTVDQAAASGSPLTGTVTGAVRSARRTRADLARRCRNPSPSPIPLARNPPSPPRSSANTRSTRIITTLPSPGLTRMIQIRPAAWNSPHPLVLIPPPEGWRLGQGLVQTTWRGA